LVSEPKTEAQPYILKKCVRTNVLHNTWENKLVLLLHESIFELPFTISDMP